MGGKGGLNMHASIDSFNIRKTWGMFCFTFFMLLLVRGHPNGYAATSPPDFKIIRTTLSKGIETIGGVDVPVKSTTDFAADDAAVISHVAFADLDKTSRFQWKWYDPAGKLYVESRPYVFSVPSGKMVRDGSVWHQISVSDEKAMNLPGEWHVNIYMDGRLISSEKFRIAAVAQPAAPTPANMPPMLLIKDIALSKNMLEAGETVNLTVTIENLGQGDAEDVFLVLESDSDAIQIDTRKKLGRIPSSGGTVSAVIPVSGTRELKQGTAALDIEVVEPNYSVKIKGKRVMIPTRELRRPVLVLASFAAVEGDSAQRNNQIDINEIVDVRFAVQNVGQAEAADIVVKVASNQEGVMFLGQGEGNILQNRPDFSIAALGSGKYEFLNYRYFVNSNFKGEELVFEISANEKSGRSGFSETKTVPINSELIAEGRIRAVEPAPEIDPGKIVIEDIPELQPTMPLPDKYAAGVERPDAVAVIIGNRNYFHRDIPIVRYAHRDAEAMKDYLINRLGYKPGNILFETDITKARFEALFGNDKNHKGRLFDYVRPGLTEVFIYYSGHGAPDPVSMQGYFVPVDCDPAAIAFNGYPLTLFYNNISKIGAKQVVVVLEACFSGGTSTGEMLVASASPFVIKAKPAPQVLKNTSILASSRSDQISSWYPEKQHGLFTYFFLKGLSGAADTNKNGIITLQELYEYVSDRTDGVPYWARRLHGGRVQEPELISSKPDYILLKY
jgi:hypothetical protein